MMMRDAKLTGDFRSLSACAFISVDVVCEECADDCLELDHFGKFRLIVLDIIIPISELDFLLIPLP